MRITKKVSRLLREVAQFLVLEISKPRLDKALSSLI